jgi:hypothetical protein
MTGNVKRKKEEEAVMSLTYLCCNSLDITTIITIIPVVLLPVFRLLHRYPKCLQNTAYMRVLLT